MFVVVWTKRKCALNGLFDVSLGETCICKLGFIARLVLQKKNWVGYVMDGWVWDLGGWGWGDVFFLQLHFATFSFGEMFGYQLVRATKLKGTNIALHVAPLGIRMPYFQQFCSV